MKFANIRYIIYIVSIIIAIGCNNQKQMIEPQPYTNGYTSDDTFTEHNDSLTHDSKSGLLYKILRDEQNFYLRLVVTNSDVQKKIIQRGLTIWFDTTASNKRLYGINFPKESDYEQLKMYSIDSQTTFYESFNTVYSGGMQLVEIKTSPDDWDPTMCYSKTEGGLNIEIKYDDRLYLCYEMQIPLSMLKKQAETFAMNIIVETGKFPYSEQPTSEEVGTPITNYNETATPTYGTNIGQSVVEHSPLSQTTKLVIKNVLIEM